MPGAPGGQCLGRASPTGLLKPPGPGWAMGNELTKSLPSERPGSATGVEPGTERSAKAVQLSEPHSPDSSCHPHGAREKLANVIWLSGRCLPLGPWATRHGEGGWSSRAHMGPQQRARIPVYAAGSSGARSPAGGGGQLEQVPCLLEPPFPPGPVGVTRFVLFSFRAVVG